MSQTCRFFGVSRTRFYMWLRRYRESGVEGLKDRPRGPRIGPYRMLPELEALILHLRKGRQYGAVRLSASLKRDRPGFRVGPHHLPHLQRTPGP